MGHALFLCNILVAHSNSVEEQLRSKAESNQRACILAIEKTGIQFVTVGVIYRAEIISYDGHVQEHLHVVLLGIDRRIHITMPRSETSLAGFLLNQDAHIRLQHVHTSLQTKHFREECRLHDNAIAVISVHLPWQNMADDSTYVHELLPCITMKTGTRFNTHQSHGIASEELYGRMPVQFVQLFLRRFSLRPVVKDGIQQFACHISQQDRLGDRVRFHTLEQRQQRRVGIGIKARNNGGDIHQEVGIQYNELGNHAAVLRKVWMYEIEHRPTMQYTGQIRMVIIPRLHITRIT